MPEPPVDDRLRALEARLAPGGAAAERLAREAGERIAAAGGSASGEAAGPPAAGWQAARPEGSAEPDPVDTLIHTFRGLLPADLQQRLAEAVRELLLALRALI